MHDTRVSYWTRPHSPYLTDRPAPKPPHPFINLGPTGDVGLVECIYMDWVSCLDGETGNGLVMCAALVLLMREGVEMGNGGSLRTLGIPVVAEFASWTGGIDSVVYLQLSAPGVLRATRHPSSDYQHHCTLDSLLEQAHVGLAWLLAQLWRHLVGVELLAPRSWESRPLVWELTLGFHTHPMPPVCNNKISGQRDTPVWLGTGPDSRHRPSAKMSKNSPPDNPVVVPPPCLAG